MSHRHPVNQAQHDNATAGQRAADAVAHQLGSWRFIVVQTAIVLVWMALNTLALVQHWDVYPFVLLNLVFSTQAAYSAPILQMTGNRAAERDRLTLEHNAQQTEEHTAILTALRAQTADIHAWMQQQGAPHA